MIGARNPVMNRLVTAALVPIVTAQAISGFGWVWYIDVAAAKGRANGRTR
jgi:hypothetical protein